MLVYVIRRSLQALLVMFVMSILVFVGVYTIGNPIDILINPLADQIEREHAIAALGLDQPLWTQYAKFLAGALHGDLAFLGVENGQRRGAGAPARSGSGGCATASRPAARGRASRSSTRRSASRSRRSTK